MAFFDRQRERQEQPTDRLPNWQFIAALRRLECHAAVERAASADAAMAAGLVAQEAATVDAEAIGKATVADVTCTGFLWTPQPC